MMKDGGVGGGEGDCEGVGCEGEGNGGFMRVLIMLLYY